MQKKLQINFFFVYKLGKINDRDFEKYLIVNFLFLNFITNRQLIHAKTSLFPVDIALYEACSRTSIKGRTAFGEGVYFFPHPLITKWFN